MAQAGAAEEEGADVGGEREHPVAASSAPRAHRSPRSPSQDSAMLMERSPHPRSSFQDGGPSHP